MGRIPSLNPSDQFPEAAVDKSVQVQPQPDGFSGTSGLVGALTFQLASSADLISPWGLDPSVRDSQLRAFWPTESFLAGGIANVCFRNSSYGWEIKSASPAVEKSVTDMLLSAIAGDYFGWQPFIDKFSLDLYTQDNGAFIELIRDETISPRFRGPNAPVIGIAHLDAGQCTRTGNIEYPVIYKDREGKDHKLSWYQVIPFSDFPSPIQTMNGVGYCAVTRVLRMAQIVRSIEIFKDEKIGGRHFKSIHLVSGVSRTELETEKTRGREQADNQGQIRYIDPVILASLDPEKPVSVAKLDLASLPDGFSIDDEMRWYITAMALGFGVDYQEFAPLPGGNIGSSEQSMMLHRKSSGKGPAHWMLSVINAFKNYGVIPRIAEITFTDRDEQEELEAQSVRTKALEEMAIAVHAGILTPEAAAQIMVGRGIWKKEDIDKIDPEFWKAAVQDRKTVDRGGNTVAEDAGRMDTGKTNETVGDRLRKALTWRSG